jgi:hypothetical protein
MSEESEAEDDSRRCCCVWLRGPFPATKVRAWPKRADVSSLADGVAIYRAGDRGITSARPRSVGASRRLVVPA